jgi:hypothetical protein
VFLGAVGFRQVSRKGANTVRRGIPSAQLEMLLKKAEAEQDPLKSCRAYHSALSKVLNAWDSHFSRGNVTYQDVVLRLKDRGEGDYIEYLERTVGLKRLFENLESRQDPDFGESTEEELKPLGTGFRLEIEKLATELQKR